MGMIIPFGPEGIANDLSNYLKIRKMMKAPLRDAGRGVIEDFKIQPNIRIGDWHEVSAVYKGRVKSGYFSLMIEDRTGVKQWFKDVNSIGRKLLDSGKNVESGTITFSNGLYESKWKFKPSPPLYTGYAKAVVHMFEDTNVFPLVTQEKDIHLT
ncbi:MAG TPA: hypothetical protein VJS91_10005 [Nitrososphaeraceae archaeon]|nr:hypothetical protein [Nitrososphaeraceae archaeon]